jgi:hypothetical protein
MRAEHVVCIGLLVGAATACSSDSPSMPSPPPAQIAGVWRGNATVTTVTGGECFAGIFQPLIGIAASTAVSVTQNGGSINATATSPSSGASCSYSGSVGQTAVVLNATGCTASDVIGAHCPGSGLLRDIRLQTGAINGTVTGNSIGGTEAETYNVFVGGTTVPVGTLVFSSSFSVTRQ